jgi:hypothetical protein
MGETRCLFAESSDEVAVSLEVDKEELLQLGVDEGDLGDGVISARDRF